MFFQNFNNQAHHRLGEQKELGQKKCKVIQVTGLVSEETALVAGRWGSDKLKLGIKQRSKSQP